MYVKNKARSLYNHVMSYYSQIVGRKFMLDSTLLDILFW